MWLSYYKNLFLSLGGCNLMKIKAKHVIIAIIAILVIIVGYTTNELSKDLKFFPGDYSNKFCEDQNHRGKSIPADGGMRYYAFSDNRYYCKECFESYSELMRDAHANYDSKSNRKWHKCSYYGCDDGTYELEIDGNYWCFKHYNEYLFGGGFS